jgi:hypothetical protein
MNLRRNPHYEFATIMPASDWFGDGFAFALHILYDIFN